MLERAIRSNYARQLSLMLVVTFVFVSNVSSITVDFAETTSGGEVVSSVKFNSDISGSDMSPSISPSEWLKNIDALDEGIHIRYDNPAGPILYGDYIAKPDPDDFTSDSDPYIEIAVTPDGKKWYLENPWSSSWDSAKEPTDGSVVNVPPPLLDIHKKADDGSVININTGELLDGDELALTIKKLTEKEKIKIREKILYDLIKYMHKEYQWGGNGPDKFDCSGLVNKVRKESGLDSSFAKRPNTNSLYEHLIKTSAPQKGDLIYFSVHGPNDHIGIVTSVDANGNVQKFIHASGHGVRESVIGEQTGVIVKKEGVRIVKTWKNSIYGECTTPFSPYD